MPHKEIKKMMTDSGYMVRNTVKKVVDKAKSNYRYFKLGVKESIKNDPKAQAERARMRQKAIDSGLLDPKKQKELDEKVKRGEAI